MQCPVCSKEITDMSFFCRWCNRFVPAPEKGEKAGIFRRFVAWGLDFLVPFVAWIFVTGIMAGISGDLGVLVGVLFPLGWLVWALTLFPKGQTPGKLMVGLHVVRQRTGENPGFGAMLI